jgi:hypothetical protein
MEEKGEKRTIKRENQRLRVNSVSDSEKGVNPMERKEY